MPLIRSGTLEDLPTVVDLWERAGGPTRLPGMIPEATRLLARDPEALIVAVVDDRVVGTLIVGWDGWRCHMYRLAVEPDLRRRGIARAMIEEARTRAVALGAIRLDAVVDLGNPLGIALWEAAGFAHEPHNGRFVRVVA